MDSSEDEGNMMERETQKAQDGTWKAGYAEGKDEGGREEFQASFNKGYELAFRISMHFGLLQGMLDALTARDGSVTNFIKPVMEQLDKAKKKLTTLDSLPPEKDGKEVEEEFTSRLNEIKEQFIKLYPYGEEDAEKLLKSVETS